MVAGSRFGNARGFQDGALASAVPSWTRPAIRSLTRAGDLPAMVAFYLLAAAALLLPWPFGAHPDWAYNWEGYTAWRWATYWEPPTGPTVAIWAPGDGLMTDSGQGPLVGLPVALGIALAGVGIDAMRVPVSLLAAAATPLLWLFGRRVAGAGPATLSALLLATSPVFLLYGRTATLVGVSLVPLLLTAMALARVLDAPLDAGWRWRREGALVGTLLLGLYAYAPIRLLWPIAVALLGYAALRDRARRGVLLRAALLCAVVVPLATMTAEQLAAPAPEPARAALGYFHARGEQLVAMSAEPAAAAEYLRETPRGEPGEWDHAWLLVGQNAADLARLLLDRDTLPVPTDYWNAGGRLWPWFLLPFAVLGTWSAVRRGLRGGRIVSLAPLVLASGLALPLLLTSRVHIGRLLPAFPFLLLLAGVGVWVVAGWLAARARAIGADEAARGIAPWLASAILLPALVLAHVELGTPLDPPREALTVSVLAAWHAAASERGGAVLVEDPAVGDDIEGVHAATYRLDLDRLYRFVEVRQGEEKVAADSRPPLLWRGALGALTAGEIVAPCDRLWFVAPEIAAEFLDAWRGAGCTGAPDSVTLP